MYHFSGANGEIDGNNLKPRKKQKDMLGNFCLKQETKKQTEKARQKILSISGTHKINRKTITAIYSYAWLVSHALLYLQASSFEPNAIPSQI